MTSFVQSIDQKKKTPALPRSQPADAHGTSQKAAGQDLRWVHSIGKLGERWSSMMFHRKSEPRKEMMYENSRTTEAVYCF